MVLVKAAKDRRGDDAVAVANAMAGRHRREVGGIRNTRSEARVRTPALVVRDPLPENSAEVALVERNHPIQTFSPNRANHAFAEGVRLRRSRGRLENGEPHRRDCPIDTV